MEIITARYQRNWIVLSGTSVSAKAVSYRLYWRWLIHHVRVDGHPLDALWFDHLLRWVGTIDSASSNPTTFRRCAEASAPS